jgi:FkbH-like protein
MKKFQNHKFQVLVCSNVTIHPLEEYIAEELVEYDLAVTLGNFDNVWADAAESKADFVLIHNEILNLTQEYSTRFFDSQYSIEVAAHLEAQVNTLQRSLKRQDAPRIISTSLSPFPLGLRRLNSSVAELCHRYDLAMLEVSSSVIDFGRLLSEFGLDSAINWSSFYRFVAPYEHEFLRLLARNISSEVKILCEGYKKVLSVDLDNTLWGGILGEDGPDHLVLDDTTPKGKCFEEVQRLLASLSTKGTLLAISSKNNFNEVKKLFEQLEMPLSLDSFSNTAINWHDKVQNLRQMAKELNLDTDSFVFLDDSDFEIASVSGHLPEVRCFKVPESTFIYPYWFRQDVLPQFGGQTKTEEDAKRVAYYKMERERSNAQTHFESEIDFISSLELSLTMKIEDALGILRVAQMTQKTNQFNLTTRRYTEENISRMLLDEDCLVISGAVADRFGDSGKTMLAIIDQCKTDSPRIDSFLISCRVIGRGLEYTFIAKLLGHLKAQGHKCVSAEYIKTEKNSQVSDFFDRAGFTLVNRFSEGHEYRLLLNDYQLELKGNINVKFGGN